MKPVLRNYDPRAKLFMAAGLSTIAVFIQHAYVLGFILILSVLLSFFSYGNPAETLKKTKNLWYLFLVIVLLQSIFSRAGNPILYAGSFAILTSGGLLKGLEFILRLAIIIFSATIIASSKYREIIQGFIQLKIPYEIAFMISVGIRFLPLLRNEFKDVLTAIQLRGIDMRKIPFKKKIKVYSYIFTPVIAQAINKAHKLAIAMETRAFRAYPERTSYLVLTMELKDYMAIIITFLLTASVFIIYYIFKFPGRLL